MTTTAATGHRTAHRNLKLRDLHPQTSKSQWSPI